MKTKDLFEIDKVQVFDRVTGNWICTMSLYDKTGDNRLIEDYRPTIEQPKVTEDKNQMKLF